MTAGARETAPRIPATYAEVTVDYHSCPLVRLSTGLKGCRIECCTATAPPPAPPHVDFLVRSDPHAPRVDLAAREEGVQPRYQGDGFHAYRLLAGPCKDCYHPLLRSHGLLPLKAVASDGALHLSALVEDPAELKGLLQAFRDRGLTPRLDTLSASAAPRSSGPPAPALEGLTPRQRQVLEDAYRAGYFHGKDLDVEAHARGLGMCVSTYYTHLRAGAHKVLQHVMRHGEP